MHAPIVHELNHAEVMARNTPTSYGATYANRNRERYLRSHVALIQPMPGIYSGRIAGLEARARAGKKPGEA